MHFSVFIPNLQDLKKTSKLSTSKILCDIGKHAKSKRRSISLKVLQ